MLLACKEQIISQISFLSEPSQEKTRTSGSPARWTLATAEFIHTSVRKTRFGASMASVSSRLLAAHSYVAQPAKSTCDPKKR